MAYPIRLKRYSVETEAGWHSYSLDGDLVALVGAVNTGKTSFFEGVAYTFGADPVWPVAMDRFVHRVETEIFLGGQHVRLRRSVRGATRQVELLEPDGTLTEILPLKDVDDTGRTTLSHWLMDALSLSNLLGTARRGKKPVTFNELLDFMYVRQSTIDQKIAGHRADRPSALRQTLFELLFGLSTPDLPALEAELRAVSDTIRQLNQDQASISTFLNASTATNLDAIQADIARATEEHEAAERRLKVIEAELTALTGAAEPLRAALRQAVDEAEAAHRRSSSARRALSDSESSVDQLRKRLEKAHKPVLHCLHCQADLSRRTLPENTCPLCTETNVDLAAATTLLQLQLDAARDRVVQGQARVAEAEKAAAAADARVGDLQQRLDEATRRLIAPHADQLADARVAVAESAARLQSLQRLVEPHQRLRTLKEQLREAEERRAELTQARKDLIDSYAVRRSDVLDSLNDIFGDVVAEMDLPWYAGDARIDRDTYLPIVDGQGVERLGGGTRAAVTVGYHVSLLRYLLTNRVGDLPTFLMIDSPTKNIGRNDWDTRFAQRIYSSFVDFVTARAGAGITTDPFQVVVADNDLPASVRGHVLVHDFDHDRPLIPGLRNPHAAEQSSN
ncbi:hypothetical protein ABZ667_02250 [Streptomyces lavendulae]|uniref:hypothetical protein n=1 Tax=Streptomyces lavendulae TaxID=1914 RepID=UPI00340BB500